MVQPILSASSEWDRIFPLFLKTQSTRLEYQNIATTRKNKNKITKPKDAHNTKKIPHKTLNLSNPYMSLHTPDSLYNLISLITFSHHDPEYL